MDFSERLSKLACDADNLRKKASICLGLLNTIPLENESHWWSCRAYIAGTQGAEPSLLQRLNLGR